MSRKNCKQFKKFLWIKNCVKQGLLRETTNLCVEIMNSGLNFILLLPVVITPSERRKRLEAIG